MANQSIKIKSLNEHVVESVSTVLFNEKFPSCEVTPDGIVALVDEIASYHEEGKELFPHILITTNLSALLKSIPSVQKIVVRVNELCVQEFYAALKLCAPLAVDGWVVFLEINVPNKTIKSGLLSTELSETSPSLHRQLIGDMASNGVEYPFVYISNIGHRTVLIEGLKEKIAVSLSLKAIQDISSGFAKPLAANVAKKTPPAIRDTFEFYMEKLLNTALKECHGTLVAVVEDDKPSIDFLKTCLEDGTYLEEPIDLALFVVNSEQEKSREASTMVRIYSRIIHNMINLDGITILSSAGKVLGYHCFVKQGDSKDAPGGARSRAYEAMVSSKAFVCCLYKSQDGNEKYWSRND